ncbi:hypothetical protein [Henriciella aquimarina]|uniref:hypothetical protein n=1 Tax=Henriciella aquimarina TaxID=545261 RepID=UPI000A03AAA7|nr:hypothetical protein [Henriciella aquimarina]
MGDKMHLRTTNGQLSLFSTYKLFFIGLTVTISLVIWFSTLVDVLAGGQETDSLVLDEDTSEAAFMTGYYVGAVVVTPILAALMAAIFAAPMTFGVWLYRFWRPVSVSGPEEVFE